jgi:hypothetical protein
VEENKTDEKESDEKETDEKATDDQETDDKDTDDKEPAPAKAAEEATETKDLLGDDDNQDVIF